MKSHVSDGAVFLTRYDGSLHSLQRGWLHSTRSAWGGGHWLVHSENILPLPRITPPRAHFNAKSLCKHAAQHP